MPKQSAQPAGPHVTQLRAEPSGAVDGANDCWEASLAAYLRDVARPGLEPDDLALIGRIRLLATGLPETEGQPGTGFAQAERSLRALRVAFRFAPLYDDALAAPRSIVLVDGRALAPRAYPEDWIPAYEAGQGNHFVYWRPAQAGQPDWFDDPLVADRDVQYSLASVRDAFHGAYIVWEPLHAVKAPCALKIRPDHACAALCTLEAGTHVEPAGPHTPHWSQVRVNARTGWILTENID